MSFGETSGYPTWENYIPDFKTQTKIMAIMADLAYEKEYHLTGATLDEDNYVITLGTTVYFTAKGEYAVLEPDCGAERLKLSYEDGSLVSRYYQFPVPGIDPNKFAKVIDAYVDENDLAHLSLNVDPGTFFTIGQDAIVSGFKGADADYFNTHGTPILSIVDNVIVYQANLPGPYESIKPCKGRVSLFNFDQDYKPGLPPVYGNVPPLYNEDLPCPIAPVDPAVINFAEIDKCGIATLDLGTYSGNPGAYIVGQEVIVSGFEGQDALCFNGLVRILEVNNNPNQIKYKAFCDGPYISESVEGAIVETTCDCTPDPQSCTPPDWPPADPLDTIAYCVPNPGQPFLNRSSFVGKKCSNVLGYFKPPKPKCKDDPYVIAFHCLVNGKEVSNNPLDTLQYFQFQTLIIRTKGEVGVKDFGDGVDVVNEDGDLIDRDGNPITVMYYLNEVDYFQIFAEQPNLSYGYNLSFNSYVFSFRGSTYLPDFLEEVVPPEILIRDLEAANPAELLEKYRPWLVNKATAMYKSIAKTTNFEYFLTPFPEEESIRIRKNYAIYLGSTCFTGHSYGGSLANILAQYLVERFPVYVNVQTYSFAPVPYLRLGAETVDGDFYNGLLLIRGFANDNDCVPFLKVPNFLDEPQVYVQPLEPPNIYKFYHIKSEGALECGDYSKKNCCEPATLERIRSICFPNNGIPIYLSINKDHRSAIYVENIGNINKKQFAKIINSNNGICDFNITISAAIKTLIASIPVALENNGSCNSIGVDPREQPLRYLYLFTGLNELCVNWYNLVDSLRLC